MSTTTPSVRKSRKTLKQSLERFKTIAEASESDKYLNKEEKKELSEWASKQITTGLIHKKSFTGLKGFTNSVTPNILLSEARRLELEHAKAETKAVKDDTDHYHELYITLSERAKRRAEEEEESQRHGSAPTESSPSSNNLTNKIIDRKIYNVTADDEFTYNSVPSLIDMGQSPNVLPHAAQTAPPTEASVGLSLDLRSSKGPNPGHPSVSGNIQMGAQSSQEALEQVGIGRVAGSGGRTSTGRDSLQYHGHHKSPSMSSNKSDPPRAPSSASIRPSLPVPPYRLRQRRHVETKVPSSSSQPSSERYGVEPISTEKFEGNTYGAAQSYYGDTEPITMPQDKTFSNYWSDASTEEEHISENLGDSEQ